MENLVLITIGILVLLIIARFVFKAAKGIITLVAALVIFAVGLHYLSPETVDKLIGAERHTRWADTIEDRTKSGIDNVGSKIQEKLDEVEK